MKFAKIFLSAALLLTMTACSDKNSAEVSDLPDVTTSESVTVSSGETTAQAEETTTIAEVTTVSQTETEASSEAVAAEEKDAGEEILDLSGYSGNFYDWEFAEDIVVYDRKDFPVSDEIMANAVQAVRESENFAVHKENFEALTYMTEEEKKPAYDENGEALINFSSGIYEDFDGDGKKEAFILLESYLLPGLMTENDGRYIYTVFVNSDGETTLLDDYTDRTEYDIRVIRYKDFMHIFIYYRAQMEGFSSWGGIVYAVDGNEIVCKWEPGFNFIEKIPGSAFVYASGRQDNSYNICFWNEEMKRYCCLEGEDISDEDNKKLIEIAYPDYPFDLSGLDAHIVGGKYYCLQGMTFGYTSYEKINGEFVESGITGFSLNGRLGTAVPVTGINIDEAESKAIPVR